MVFKTRLHERAWSVCIRDHCMYVRRHTYVPSACLALQLYLTANHQILDIVYKTRHNSLKSKVEQNLEVGFSYHSPQQSLVLGRVIKCMFCEEF